MPLSLASLLVAIAAPALMFELSMLPLNSLEMVFMGLFRLAALTAVELSEACCGEIKPMASSLSIILL
jgi:hypothetical protein